MRDQRSRRVLFTAVLGIGTLATWTLFGAPTVGPKPGGAGPKPTPAPVLRLPANAQKAKVKLVPNLPNAPKTTRTPGQPWLTRAFGTKCIQGGECLLLGMELGTRASGQKAPAGMYLSYYPTAGGSITDNKLEPTNWTPTVVGFKPPPGMHAGVRYTVLVRNAQGKAVSNSIEVDVVALPDPRANPDFDGDGERSVGAGGLDCDDFNKERAPGRTEKADPKDIDEDCDPTTFGARDNDADGAPDALACNVGITGSGLDRKAVFYCGSDCDDTSGAIKPDAMLCDPRDTSVIFVCTAQRSWTVDPRSTPGPDGFLPPYTCASFASGARCVSQPNRLGVCQVGAP